MRDQLLFERVADIIEINPEAYNQELWRNSCGTAFCIAGHVINEVNAGIWRDLDSSGFTPPRLFLETDKYNAGDYAKEILGLSDCEAQILFDSDWAPAEGMTVSDALRKLGAGARLEDVSHELDDIIISLLEVDNSLL